MKVACLLAAVLARAEGEFTCERFGACGVREEEGNALLHTNMLNIHKANSTSKHSAKHQLMNFEHPPANYAFDQYIKDFGKDYKKDSKEYSERKATFEKSLKAVQEHNTDATSTYKLGLNVYSDWSAQELKGLRGLKKMAGGREASAFKLGGLHLERNTGDYPKSVDWRTAGVVTPAKNQGHCGSCWAFATTGVVESHSAIYSGVLLVLSPGQLVSCAENPDHCGGTGGCDGSTAEIAMDYIKDKGMVEEEVIPYENFFGEDVPCTPEMAMKASMYQTVSITGWVKTTTNSAADVFAAIVNYGPLAISVDASNWSPYSSGVMNPCDLSKDPNMNVDIDHAVVLVGYGEEGGGTFSTAVKYWLVRNSWGATWGEHGYIRLAREYDGKNDDEYCGMDNTPHHGSACEAEPDTPVKVCGVCGILYDVSYPTGAMVLGVGQGTGAVDR